LRLILIELAEIKQKVARIRQSEQRAPVGEAKGYR
jgi:hypothetical protein